MLDHYLEEEGIFLVYPIVHPLVINGGWWGNPKLAPEVSEWLEEQCPGKYGLFDDRMIVAAGLRSSKDRPIMPLEECLEPERGVMLAFEDEDDAMMFKLRWG